MLIFSEKDIGNLLPLAHEYDVRCVLRKCETWLVTEFKFKAAKEPSHYVGVDNNVDYFMKCLYYGAVYNLRTIYDKVLQALIPYKLKRYANNEFYKLLPEKSKRELLESRLSRIEDEGRVNFNDPGLRGSIGWFDCSGNLFL